MSQNCSLDLPVEQKDCCLFLLSCKIRPDFPPVTGWKASCRVLPNKTFLTYGTEQRLCLVALFTAQCFSRRALLAATECALILADNRTRSAAASATKFATDLILKGEALVHSPAPLRQHPCSGHRSQGYCRLTGCPCREVDSFELCIQPSVHYIRECYRIIKRQCHMLSQLLK